MKNAWQYEIPSVDEILDKPDLRDLIGEVSRKMLKAVGQSPSAVDELVGFLFSRNSPRDILELEKVLHDRIALQGSGQVKMQNGMRGRAKTIYSQIEGYLLGKSLADIGCGHGLISLEARKHFKEVLLLDVVDYRDSEVVLPFVRFSEGDAPPFGKSFDCTLLITVLHHAVNPMKLLEDVWKYTGSRLIVIESVFSVSTGSTNSPLPLLDQPAQLCYAVYCDWFYNRVLNQGIPVPYNFNTPDNWRKLFSNLPAKVAFEEDLGVDLDIVPEHHFLSVLDKA